MHWSDKIVNHQIASHLTLPVSSHECIYSLAKIKYPSTKDSLKTAYNPMWKKGNLDFLSHKYPMLTAQDIQIPISSFYRIIPWCFVIKMKTESIRILINCQNRFLHKPCFHNSNPLSLGELKVAELDNPSS